MPADDYTNRMMQSTKQRKTPPLTFPQEVKPYLTPFRCRVLQSMSNIAYRELGDKIESVGVCLQPDYEETGRRTLWLAIWADMEKAEWSRAHEAISDAIFDLSADWTKDERADYGENIFFALSPVPGKA